MAVKADSKNGATVWLDSEYPWKVYDAMGDGVRKYSLQPGFPCDDTTGDPTQFTMTVVEGGAGDTTVVNGTNIGYPMLITTDAAEYDGVNLQLKGEQAKLASGQTVNLRGVFKLSEDTQNDFLFGLAETKSDLLKYENAHGITATNVEGAFFYKADGAKTIKFKVYKNGSEVFTVDCGDATKVDQEYAIDFDGAKITIYLDNVKIAEFAGTLPDGELTPSINLRAGSAAANTCAVKVLDFVAIG